MKPPPPLTSEKAREMRTLGGRTSKLTQSVIDEFVKSFRLGLHVTTACRIAGVNPDTYYEWRKQAMLVDENGEPLENYAQQRKFAEACEQALGEFERFCVSRWMGGKAGWQGPASLVRLRFRKRWGDKATVEHTGKDGNPLELVIRAPASMSDDELKAISEGNHPALEAGDAETEPEE